jgi:hypothetical protein
MSKAACPKALSVTICISSGTHTKKELCECEETKHRDFQRSKREQLTTSTKPQKHCFSSDLNSAQTAIKANIIRNTHTFHHKTVASSSESVAIR